MAYVAGPLHYLSRRSEMSGTRTQQITESIRARIRAGEYQPKKRIPSHKSLGEEFGVSRSTIARALSELKESGYVWSLPHKGSFALAREDWRDSSAKTCG